jgi:hypothetical protein
MISQENKRRQHGHWKIYRLRSNRGNPGTSSRSGDGMSAHTSGIWNVEYKSVLSGEWVISHLGQFASEKKALNAGKREFGGSYEYRAAIAKVEASK